MMTFRWSGRYPRGLAFFQPATFSRQLLRSPGFTRELTVVSRSLMSATMPSAAGTFLSIDEGSQSTCTMRAFPAYRAMSSPVTRSLKRTPSASTRSAPAIAAFAANVPWTPAMPSASGSSGSKLPMPIRVVATGMSARFASTATSRAAFAEMTPPPA